MFVAAIVASFVIAKQRNTETHDRKRNEACRIKAIGFELLFEYFGSGCGGAEHGMIAVVGSVYCSCEILICSFLLRIDCVARDNRLNFGWTHSRSTTCPVVTGGLKDVSETVRTSLDLRSSRPPE